MPTRKRPHVALIMMFGMFIAAVTLAGPAGAAPYVPPVPTQVLGEVVTSDVPGQDTGSNVDTGALASGDTGGLASTGRNVIGVGALGGLLLVGGGLMVFAGKRRKVDA